MKKGVGTKDFVKRTGVFFRALTKIGLLFTYFRIAYHEWLYKVHLSVRKAHDNTYSNIKWYKNWTDKPYSAPVHQAVFWAFILSFGFFSIFQTSFPFFNKPKKALADSHTITWTTDADFNNNANTINQPTVKDAVAVDGDTLRIDSFNKIRDINDQDKFVYNIGRVGYRPGPNTELAFAVEAIDYPYDVHIINTTTGEIVKDMPSPYGRARGVSWSADGTRLVVGGGGGDSDVYIYDTTSADPADWSTTPIHTISSPGFYDAHPVFSSDGAYLSVSWAYHQRTQIYNTSDWSMVREIVGYYTVSPNPWSSNRGYLALNNAWEPSTFLFDTSGGVPADWSSAITLPKSGYVDFSPDSTKISVADSIFNLPDGTEYFAHNDASITGITFSKYNNLENAVSLSDGTVKHYDSSNTYTGKTTVSGGVPCSAGFGGLNGDQILLGCGTAAAVYKANSYASSGSVSGLIFDAGSGLRPAWTSIDYTASKPEGTSVAFFVRASDDLSDIGMNGDAVWRATYANSDTNFYIVDNVIFPSRYIEIKVVLNSSDSLRPELSDFTLNYNTIPVPTNISIYNADNNERGMYESPTWVGGTSVLVKADVQAAENSSTIITEIDFYEPGDSGASVVGQTVLYEDKKIEQADVARMYGLANNTTYRIRLRFLDSKGRASSFTNWFDIRVDQQGPVVDFKINNDNPVTNQRSVLLDLNINDNESSVESMRFSSDGRDWTTWEPKTNQKAWLLSEGNGEKNVYVQAKDSAGNISGKRWASNIDFNKNGLSSNGNVTKQDITVEGSGDNSYAEAHLAGAVGVNKIVTNDDASYFIDKNGDLWGAGRKRALAQNDASEDSLPWTKINLPSGKKAQKVFANDCGNGVYVITDDNLMYAAGKNNGGSLGVTDVYIEHENNRVEWLDVLEWMPVKDNLGNQIDDVVDFAAGYSQAMMKRSDNKLWIAGQSWALGKSEDVGLFERDSRIAEDINQVASACYGHSLILDKNNIVKGLDGGEEFDAPVGSNRNQWTTLSGGWSGARKIGAGGGSSYVEDAEGYIWVAGTESGWTLGFPGYPIKWQKNGLRGVKKFIIAGSSSAAILQDNSMVVSTAAGNNFFGGKGIPGYRRIDKGYYSDFVGNGYCGALFVSTSGRITASGQSFCVGLPDSGYDLRTNVDTGSGTGSFEDFGYLGNPAVPGTGLVYSGDSLSKVTNIYNTSFFSGFSADEDSSLRFGVRYSLDGVTWSGIKGRDGQPLSWDNNYFGYHGSSDDKNLYDNPSSIPAALKYELVYRIDGGAGSFSLSPVLLEVAALRSINLDMTGPDISFDPNKKYPAEDWNVKENVNSIEFRFGTNKNAITYVDYGTVTPDSEAKGETKYGTSHSILVKNLNSNTGYKYRIRAFDDLGNETVLPFDQNNPSEGYDAKTTSSDTGFEGLPQVSSLSQVEITASTAKITWRTKSPTSSYIDYGPTSDYGDTAGDPVLTTVHVVELKNLTAGLTYNYRVRGNDANGNESASGNFTFKAVMKPEISNIKVKDTSPYEATIIWDTNVGTDSAINYGNALPYGNREYTSEKVNNHQMKIQKLEDKTTYYYQIEARDEYGNITKSNNQTFETPLDTVGPKIEDVKIDIMPVDSDTSAAHVIVSWKTNKPSTGKIEYDEGIIGGKYGKSTIEDDSLNSTHTVIIKDLNPNTTYHFRIVSRDKRSNETESIDYNLVTPAKQKSIWQLIIKSIEDTFAWTKNMGQFLDGVRQKATQ